MNKKGITLISLAITVTILLILAGVGIGTLGPGGLIAKAGNDENCYYLDGLGNCSIDTNVTAFTKATSSQVVTNLNKYIDDHLEDETTNTSTWKKWKVGANGYPTFE